jgi:hypothetical protein
MKITILFDELDATTLAALLQLPYSTKVHTERSGLYGAQVELDTPGDAGELIDGLIASMHADPINGWTSVETDIEAPDQEPEHTAPELIGQQVRVFTFGPDHTHPMSGQSLAGRFVRVPGDANTARDRALAIFGRDFATDHDAATAARLIAKYNLDEINPRPVFLDEHETGAQWQWHMAEVKSVSDHRFQVVNELAAVVGLDSVPAPDSEDTEVAMAASMNGPILNDFSNGQGPA